ncbi:glutamate formimidoyltransferase [Hyphobacterium sp. CCMP332]|nr:glutamate formimidoyltransferase [Hyphobacterium sp. CCMP332]
MKQVLIECVPNFSEGRDLNIIKQITNEIESVEGVKLLDVDPGKATNRTVVTFVGNPEAVKNAALLAMLKAKELIDMSKHNGEHPRFGATDVCPLIPVANISMEETVEHARDLAKRAGEQLDYPIYCYENAALSPSRKNLAKVRAGEYEGLEARLKKEEHKPDFGPAVFRPKSGATAIGARDFLIAYNFNLNTTSPRRANSIAFDVREAGRVKRKGDPVSGEIVRDKDGNPERVAGTCKATKGIGWYIEEYGIAQVSMNLTNINVSPVHIVFDEIVKSATSRGIRVTGSELVGLVPKKVMIDAGKHYLKKQQRSTGVSEAVLIKIAVKSLGLDDLKPFDPRKKIIEYQIEDTNSAPLVNLKLNEFADETASESIAPGGGSVSAYLGALGASLGTMVANLSSHKRGWDERWEEFSNWAEKGQNIKDRLIRLVDEDTNAFNRIIAAVRMPKDSTEEKTLRKAAMQEATKYAIEIPLETMRVSMEAIELAREMAKIGNPNSASDAGVGALSGRAAVRGAYLNVKINSKDLDDKVFLKKTLKEAAEIDTRAEKIENEVMNFLDGKLN